MTQKRHKMVVNNVAASCVDPFSHLIHPGILVTLKYTDFSTSVNKTE